MNKSAKILITGSSGFIGRNLLLKFIDYRFDNIIALQDADQSAIPDLPKGIQTVSGDLFDTYFLRDVLKDVQYLVHTSSLVSYAPKDKKALYKYNVELTTNLVDAALENPLEGFVYIGTTAALENNKDSKPVSERNTWQKQKGKSYYSISRFLAEMEVWRGAAEGLPVLVLSPTNILGKDSNNHIQRYLLDQLNSGNFSTPGGSGGFIDIRDLTEFIVQYLSDDKPWNEKYILNSAHASYADLLHTMTVISGNEMHIEVRKYLNEWFFRLLRPRSSLFKSSALNRTFYKSLETDLLFNADKAFEAGFAPKYLLEESLKDIIKAV